MDYKTVDIKTSDSETDLSSQHTRVGPVRSDSESTKRRLLAERDILHSRPDYASEPPVGPQKHKDHSRHADHPRLIAGRYALGPRIGRGRFGPIYFAEDFSVSDVAPDRHLALEILPKAFGSFDWIVERFESEFQRLRAWRHENIVKVLDFGNDGDQFFWATELLDGASLRSIASELGDDRAETTAAHAIVLGVGRALQYAHARKKVHGAINMDNVFLTSDYNVKVLDFTALPIKRTASLREKDLASDRSLARTSDDVYGLASIAFELLSGAAPYDGSLPDEARYAGLELKRPTGLPRRYWKALRAGLALDPGERTASVDRLLADLAISGQERIEPVEPQRRAGQHARRISRTGRYVVWAATAVVSAGLAIIGYGIIAGPTPTLESTAASPQIPAENVGLSPPVGRDVSNRRATVDATPLADRDLSTVSRPTDEQGLPSQEFQSVEELPNAALVSTFGADPPATENNPPPRAAADGPATETEPAATSLGGSPEAVIQPSFEFAQTLVTVTEDAAVAALVVRRMGPTTGDAQISWWTADGTALGDEDFASFGTLTEQFADGQRTRAILIPLVGDALPEPTERFMVTIEYDSANATQLRKQAEVVILDDD